MSLFDSFGTDKNVEKTGITYTPDSQTAITLARAGGANVKYQKMLVAETKPFKRQINTDTMDPEVEKKILRGVYAKTVVLNWETLVDGEDDDNPARLAQGIEMWPGYVGDLTEDGLVPFTSENVVKIFTMLPELFTDVMATASNYALFRQQEREDDAGN